MLNMSARSRSTISSRRIRFGRRTTRAGRTPSTSASTATVWFSISGWLTSTPVIAHLLSLAPFSRIVKDYFTVCDSYYAAIRGATPDRIEALDMARRSLHDEGSHILMERLKRKVEVDFDTARRLFTLVTVLHWKG